MIIKEDHFLFKVLKINALSKIVEETEKLWEDSLGMISGLMRGDRPFSRTVLESCKDVQHSFRTNSLEYFVITKSVVNLSDKIDPVKLIDKNGFWMNAIKKEITGAAIFESKVMYFSIKKDRLGCVVMDSSNIQYLSAFAVDQDGHDKWLANRDDNYILPLMKTILYMIFAETELISLNNQKSKRYKDRDGQKHLNQTGVNFFVVDKTWTGKIAIGGHIRSGHFAIRYTGVRSDPTPKIVWIATTTVSPYVKNAKRDL